MNTLMRCLNYIATIVMLLCLTGCSNVSSSASSNGSVLEPESAWQTMEEPVTQTKWEYILQANDVLDIKFPYEPQLNERVTIRPDGKISLQIVDEIDAEGLTCAQLDEVLTEKYSTVLNKPELSVIAREFSGQKVYVGGEVLDPGIINLNGKMTALEAIFAAGGFRETAEPKSVIVISRSPQNTRLVRKVDLEGVLVGAAAGKELFLEPFDVIHVPKSAVAEANKFVDQHIRKMIPVNLSAGFSYTIFRERHPD